MALATRFKMGESNHDLRVLLNETGDSVDGIIVYKLNKPLVNAYNNVVARCIAMLNGAKNVGYYIALVMVSIDGSVPMLALAQVYLDSPDDTCAPLDLSREWLSHHFVHGRSKIRMVKSTSDPQRFMPKLFPNVEFVTYRRNNVALMSETLFVNAVMGAEKTYEKTIGDVIVTMCLYPKKVTIVFHAGTCDVPLIIMPLDAELRPKRFKRWLISGNAFLVVEKYISIATDKDTTSLTWDTFAVSWPV